jgi:hypothetical protein
LRTRGGIPQRGIYASMNTAAGGSARNGAPYSSHVARDRTRRIEPGSGRGQRSDEALALFSTIATFREGAFFGLIMP